MADHAGVLVCSDVGGEEVWPALEHGERKRRSERVAEEDERACWKALAKVFGDLDAVAGEAIERERAGLLLSGAGKRLAGAALVPMDDGEVFLPCADLWSEHRTGGAGTSVKDKQERISAIFAADADPLLDASNEEEELLVDHARAGEAQRAGDRALAHLAVDEDGGGESKDDRACNYEPRENHVASCKIVYYIHSSIQKDCFGQTHMGGISRSRVESVSFGEMVGKIGSRRRRRAAGQVRRKKVKETFKLTSASVLWEAREAGSRGPKPGLSAEMVARAAVKVADAEGLDAVSMQRVAQEAGVTTMALYRYVKNKEELIDRMIE